jgi:hypothetical protein
MFLKVVVLTFFQLNSYFRCHRAIRDISAHRRTFAPPLQPSARVYDNREATQKNGDNSFSFDDFTVCLLTFFSIKLLFSGYHATRDFSAHRWIVVTPLASPARFYYNRGALQK